MKYAKIPEDCLMNFSDSEMVSGGEDHTTSESESSSDSEEEREKRLKELQEQVCMLQFFHIPNSYWHKMISGFAQTLENLQITKCIFEGNLIRGHSSFWLRGKPAEIQRMGTRVMVTTSECITFTFLTVMAAETLQESGLLQKPWTRPVLIKSLKQAMCAFCVS